MVVQIIPFNNLLLVPIFVYKWLNINLEFAHCNIRLSVISFSDTTRGCMLKEYRYREVSRAAKRYFIIMYKHDMNWIALIKKQPHLLIIRVELSVGIVHAHEYMMP
ncbi:hypothetical protein ACJX0J_010184 [Zea mays]